MSTTRPWEAHLPVTVYAHLHADTALSHRLSTTESGAGSGWVSLRLAGTNSADLSLITDRADLVRLIEAATAALADLDAASTEPEPATPTDSTGSTASAVPAA